MELIEARLELVLLTDGAEDANVVYTASGSLGERIVAAAVTATTTDVSLNNGVDLVIADPDGRVVAVAPGFAGSASAGAGRVTFWRGGVTPTNALGNDSGGPIPDLFIRPEWTVTMRLTVGAGHVTLTEPVLYVERFTVVDEDEPPAENAHPHGRYLFHGQPGARSG